MPVAVTLDDKYVLESGRVYLTGTQALVRLPMMQRQRDLAAGLNTAGYISGYRGSPLGGFDQALWQAKRFIKNNHIEFQPGVNEDLAATALWGTQQIHLYPGARYDGVFGMWYGKGPGVDRSGDVLKHANYAGTARHGGIVALAGDDHMAKSSTTAHQSEPALIAAAIPIIHAASVQEYLDLGLHAFALSRYSGLWVAFKVLSETVDSSASVHVDPHRIDIQIPTDFVLPPDGVHIRWPDDWLGQERRTLTIKHPAALAYWRANKLDRLMMGRPDARFGIVTVGKSYLDVRQALDELGIDDAEAERLGLAVYKVAMVWPLETEGVTAFAQGKREILVVEEKRPIIEQQLKDALFNAPADRRPVVVGKTDERGQKLLKIDGELSPFEIASVLVARFGLEGLSARTKQRLEALQRRSGRQVRNESGMARVPYFCSGCPHNSSTKVPEGSMAMAGIGCHTLAINMERNTKTFTHMGAEGATWVGANHFTDMPHVFQNLGDGTYFHSGYMAIRHAIATNTTITYKILYNDAVAMTGGQPHDGNVRPWTISQQVHAEGVRRIALVSDEPGKYPIGTEWAPGVSFHHRSALDDVQRELREWKGVSVLIYDQTCAAEKRRRRKRGTFPDPAKRVFINQAVCEGCGDCSVQSNCLSVTPVETEFGPKRAIDQSSCNKDFSCLNGFCPSFVTVEGGGVRKGKADKKSGRRHDRTAAAARSRPAGGGRQALWRADHRHRRHRRRHHRRHHGHGRAHRGQGRHRARPARHGAEGRRGDQPCPHRRLARGPACGAPGRGRRRPAAGLRPGGERQRRCAGPPGTRRLARHRQHAPDHHRRLHPPARPRLPGQHAPALGRGGGRRRGLRLRRGDRDRHGASGRFHRHQHVHAGLRLSEGPDPDRPRIARKGDRAERCGRGDEHRGLPLGPSRRP